MRIGNYLKTRKNIEHEALDCKSHDFWGNSELLERFLVLPISIAESLVRSEEKSEEMNKGFISFRAAAGLLTENELDSFLDKRHDFYFLYEIIRSGNKKYLSFNEHTLNEMAGI